MSFLRLQSALLQDYSQEANSSEALEAEHSMELLAENNKRSVD